MENKIEKISQLNYEKIKEFKFSYWNLSKEVEKNKLKSPENTR